MRRPFFAIVALLVFATVAWAVTEAEVLQTANALPDDYKLLEVRVDACPKGECQEAPQIESDFEDLELERDQLHADRASLDPCECTGVDAVIADVDDLAKLLGVTIGGFDQQG